MKYSRHQLNEDNYQLWEHGMTIPAAHNSVSFVVKYRIGEAKEYSLVEIKAQSIEETLEQACFRIATDSAVSPDNVDLHSIYDIEGKLLLWADKLPYVLSNSKNNENGMSRREFLTAFGLANAALLLGLPKIAMSATTSVSLTGTASGLNYVDDVFSTYLYTGNGSTKTINNGIDLAGKGGLVWFKNRDNYLGVSPQHVLYDTLRGTGQNQLSTALTNYAGESIIWGGNVDQLSAFNSNGFTVLCGGGTSTQVPLNGNTARYTSWTFRRAANFFDVVTYTGDAVAGRQISHSLGVAPGMVIIKKTSAASNWPVYHVSTGLTFAGILNGPEVPGTTAHSPVEAVSATTITLNRSASDLSSGTNPNANGVSYVAYLFANDSASSGIIKCGSFNGNYGQLVDVSLGWEPQFVMVKAIDGGGGDWVTVDVMRGWTNQPNSTNPHPDYALYPNKSNAESQAEQLGHPMATGFSFKCQNNNATTGNYIYLAIRRPNKPPTSGTQVYTAIARTGTGTATTITGVGFAPDLVLNANRSSGGGLKTWYDRLRGFARLLSTDSQAEVNNPTAITSFDMDGVSVGTDGSGDINQSSYLNVNYFFRRAPGFMDIVCDTGTGTTHSIAHNLTVAPEFIIRKSRSAATQWEVWHSGIANSEKLVLNSTAAKTSDTTTWNSTTPTSSQFTVGTSTNVNGIGATYVTYLFATLPGISKVGTYTGNDGTQTIPCGFTTSARFVLIKRSDNTGDWYIWDSARGIVAGNDPHVSLNTTAAEVTGDDSIDSINSGFIVNQMAATNINVLNANYIFLAIA